MKEEDFDRLVGLIYDSALNPGVWRDTMDDLARQLGADTLHLLGGGRAQVAAPGVVMHAPGQTPLEAEHETLLARLIPHFNRALRLMEHTQFSRLAAAGQDVAPLGIIAVDKIGQLLYCNRNGEAQLKAEDIMRIQNGVLRCVSERAEKVWDDHLSAVVKTGRPANLLLNHSATPDKRYSVTLTPLPKHSVPSVADEAEGALCLIVPLDHRRMATTHQLMQLFGLSPAEARLARALVAGDTLEFYAAENGLKLSTVKCQLHGVFEKTGADRQAALVRLIAGIPAVREPGH